ncbi:hypothetical protein BpHYR1_048449 [Brachionus plicatilis]|uniref:Uncharacterized protein n=1 Tax=Brachionus plicatilis TaxID=10195 RepID=A0A3M7RMG8_BRAPC|nr:hypothetical protein BpHYR1_048449 [Brachionus plicatilis]
MLELNNSITLVVELKKLTLISKNFQLYKNQTSLKRGNENDHLKIFSNFQFKINSKLCWIEKLKRMIMFKKFCRNIFERNISFGKIGCSTDMFFMEISFKKRNEHCKQIEH